MLVPKEAPHLKNVHNYYIVMDRFIRQMQSEVGSGCIHLISPGREGMIYFNEFEIFRCILSTGKEGSPADVPLSELLETVKEHPYRLDVHFLDLNAVYFWGRLPSRQRIMKRLSSEDHAFNVLVDGYRKGDASGFLEFNFRNGTSALLFFESGDQIGGSYSWGKGGLRPWETDIITLSETYDQVPGTINVGLFHDGKAHSRTNGITARAS